MLTVDMVERALPANLKKAATQAFTDQINSVVSDPLVAEQVRNNFISYTRVLSDGKYKTEDYLHAVTYVSFKLMGLSNQEAYFKTFPARHQNLVAKGTSQKDISAYVSAYNSGKLVNAILEQSLVPSWVLNQDLYQRALNRQAAIMDDDNAPFIARTTAANSLLQHLTKPKEAGPLVSIDMRETSGIAEMKDMLVQVAQRQQEAIRAGAKTADIAALKIIDGDAVPVP